MIKLYRLGVTGAGIAGAGLVGGMIIDDAFAPTAADREHLAAITAIEDVAKKEGAAKTQAALEEERIRQTSEIIGKQTIEDWGDGIKFGGLAVGSALILASMAKALERVKMLSAIGRLKKAADIASDPKHPDTAIAGEDIVQIKDSFGKGLRNLAFYEIHVPAEDKANVRQLLVYIGSAILRLVGKEKDKIMIVDDMDEHSVIRLQIPKSLEGKMARALNEVADKIGAPSVATASAR